MQNDIKIIQNESTVIYHGNKTTVYPYILREISRYRETRDEDDDPAFDHYERDWYGELYAAMDANHMKSEDVDWEDDCVELDEQPLHVTKRHGVYPLCAVDTPRDVCDLNESQMRELFRSVELGSVFLADYETDLFVDRSDVCDMCDEFLKYCDEELPRGKEITEDDFVEYLCAY